MNLPSIRVIWRKLGLPGEPPVRDKQDVRCPFSERHNHGDRKPSFALLNDGMNFACQGCGASGGVIAFIMEVQCADKKAAGSWLRSNFGEADLRSPGIRPPARPAKIISVESPPALIPCPFEILPASDELRADAAASRGLSESTFKMCEDYGLVRYGKFYESVVWILCSEPEGEQGQSRIYEARPIRGGMFPAIGNLAERKTHTKCEPGGKGWPVGAALASRIHGAPILLVEGSADFMAGYEVCMPIFAVPVGVLGSARIHPAALHLFHGRRVVIATHADRNEKGRMAARLWAEQLRGVSCSVSGLKFPDGYDLNDLVREGRADDVREVLQ